MIYNQSMKKKCPCTLYWQQCTLDYYSARMLLRTNFAYQFFDSSSSMHMQACWLIDSTATKNYEHIHGYDLLAWHDIQHAHHEILWCAPVHAMMQCPRSTRINIIMLFVPRRPNHMTFGELMRVYKQLRLTHERPNPFVARTTIQLMRSRPRMSSPLAPHVWELYGQEQSMSMSGWKFATPKQPCVPPWTFLPWGKHL